MPLEGVSEAFVAELAAAGEPPLHELTPAIARLGDMVAAGMTGPGPEVGRVRNLELDGREGRFRIRVLTPVTTPRAIIVYFHGGGWVLGDIDLQYNYVGRDLANRTKSTVASSTTARPPSIGSRLRSRTATPR
jgi:acetyl esterase